MSVTSVEGHGSTFTVEMPLGSAHLPAENIERATATTTADATAALTVTPAVTAVDDPVIAPFVREAQSWMDETGGTLDEPALPSDSAALAGAEILVADDNADMRNYVARLLRDAGARVVFAADGQAALQRLQERAPDLVVCDAMMPRLDGFGVLTEMRADDRSRTIPFVMLSARSGEESRVGGLTGPLAVALLERLPA